MIDSLTKPFLLPQIDALAAKTDQSGLSANQLTLIAFAIGLCGCFAVGLSAYPFGLLLLLIGRFIDALAGAVARRKGVTEKGIVLDVLCDYLIFAGFAFLFSLSASNTSMSCAFLLFSYLAMGVAYLAHAWLLARRGATELPRGGLVENGEMIVFMIVCCLYPVGYAAIAVVFGFLCWVTAGLRFGAAMKAVSQNG